MKKRILSLLLVVLMLVSLLPAAALATDTHAISVSESATTSAEVVQGGLYKLKLSDIFTDSEGHTMTYTLSGGDFGEQTKVVQDDTDGYVLAFTNSIVGTYNVTITATCDSDATVTASHTVVITVTQAADGAAGQYGYDETAQSSVKVYVTISNDGVPIVGNDTNETLLSRLEVNVPYFDLSLYGLTDYYRYGTDGGKGPYTNETLVLRPTALHLYLYMLGVYYLGYTPEEVITGEADIVGAAGNRGVYDMLGETAYEDSMKALNITGAATSLYMQQFWGHDENLMYYRNHMYPLMSAGWGSTADYILLSDNDTIDIAMFSNWNFYQNGAFACFDEDEYTVNAGSALSFSTQKYETQAVAQGGAESFEPITGMTVAIYDDTWTHLADITPTAEGGSAYSYTFNTAGTYYLLALDAAKKSDNASIAPATAKVVVGSGETPFNPSEYYKDYPFSSISLDAAGSDYIYNIASSKIYVDHFSNPGDKQLYTITVPAGTETVYVTYPASFTTTISEYCALFDSAGAANWDYFAGSDYDYSVAENADGSHTIALPAAFVLGKGLYIAAEDKDYEYFNCFNFVAGANTKPGGSTTVAAESVALDSSAITVERRKTAQLTATVLPDNASNKKVTWSTGDSAVATVDKNGLVTAVAAGETVITATSKDGGFTAQCTVTVTDSAKPNIIDGVYQIGTAAELKWFADEVNDGNKTLNAVLTANIDLSTVCSETLGSWTPIGDYSNNSGEYSGVFDGKNFTISGLYINEEGVSFTNVATYYRALFGHCTGATVKNLTVSGDVYIYNRFMAGIVGRAYNNTTVENCHNYVELHGTPTNDELYGYSGVVATAMNSTIKNCSNHGTIYGLQGYTGGVAGQISGTTSITSCYNESEVHLRGYKQSFRGVGGIVGSVNGTSITVTDCYNTGKVHCYYKTQANPQYVGGIVGSAVSAFTISNCYNVGEITGDEVSLTAASFGGIIGNAAEAATMSGCFYLEGKGDDSFAGGAVKKTDAEMISDDFVSNLGSGYQESCPYPVLTWQTAADHVDSDGNSICDVCGYEIAAVPVLKSGVSATKEDQVQVGKAYLLSELQSGSIFEGADGSAISYKQVYYQRSTDGGQTWSDLTAFDEALFGWTTIQITELSEGTYVYKFYASTDGTHFSTDTWTLTLNVVTEASFNFTAYVSRDYKYSANGNVYPIIKVYPSLGTDANGKAIPDYDNPVAMLYSDFTGTLPEGVAEYNPANGTVASNYNMFYFSAPAGKYVYEAFAWNADTSAYDISLGGMQLELPTDQNVDGGASGGTDIYLKCVSYYTTSKKTDNTYFGADEYHVKLDSPIMGCTATMGTVYTSGNYAYYPVMLYAGGNASLYNFYFYPDISGYMFSQSINATYQPAYTTQNVSGSINKATELEVTVPQAGDFGLYFQWNNFNTTEVEPEGEAVKNDDGTKTYTYQVSASNGNYTWRLSGEGYVTRSGWLTTGSSKLSLSYDFEGAYTDTNTHDFSHLGGAVIKRDEADLMVNLDPSGYSALDGTTRIRTYRHWEIINSDAGNIMIEPDFHWTVLDGNASVATVDGGNTTANWADVTSGTKDSILSVYYDAMEVEPGNYGTHGGLFPATNPERVGVVVVAGTDTKHGTADADVDFNMAVGATTTRSMDWDYNYDTWFYTADDTAPALNFAVNSTGDTSVSYKFVTTDSTMNIKLSDSWTTVQAGTDGRYTVDLTSMKTLGNGMGGTVIIRMEDSTGVSYRLVRVAKVTVTVTNVTNDGEPFMPGNEVQLTFDGLYRAVNKISGIFNPTTFYLRYTSGDTEVSGTTGQYQQMDSSVIKLTIPDNVEFPDGESSVDYSFTNGYIYGSMYSAANPFAFLYGMTDTGVGTNFNAVSVSFYISHLANVTIPVVKTVTYDVSFNVLDSKTGEAVSGYALTVTDADGNVCQANSDGIYTLAVGTYSYSLSRPGYYAQKDSFKLSTTTANENGAVSIKFSMEYAGENAWDGSSSSQPAQDENNVYLISNGAELKWFADAVNGGQTGISARLTADINLANGEWTPIGGTANKYTGTFDGNGFTITHFVINATGTAGYYGFFGYINGATVKDFTISGKLNYVPGASLANAYTGGVIGYATGASVISGITSDVDVSVVRSAGYCSGVAGVVGFASASTITNCVNKGSVNGYRYVGGIVGNTSGAVNITNCSNEGEVQGYTYPAGVIGYMTSAANAVVDGCTNTGKVTTTGTSYMGGVIGYISGAATVKNCINNADIDSEGLVTGVIGYISGTTAVTNCANTGKLTGHGTAKVAGIVNYASGGVTIDRCYNSGDIVIADGATGSHGAGIVYYGYQKGSITNCYNTGNISGAEYVGGILSYVFASNAENYIVENCYNAGALTGTNVGGILGYDYTNSASYSCDIKNSYFINSTENAVGAIRNGYYTLTNVEAKTSSELKEIAETLGESYKKNTSVIYNGGYPVLAWETVPVPVTATVDFTAQMQNGFLCAPQNDVTVSSDLAESYGYADSVPYTDGVSALDVLVMAHEIIFADGFTAETKDTMLAVKASGTISTIFGVETGNCGFTVNDMSPVDQNSIKDSYGYYTGYTITQAAVTDGDALNFFIYQDSYAMDNYLFFTDGENYGRDFTVEQNKTLTLSAMGYCIGWYGTQCKTFDEVKAKLAGIPDAQLAIVNMETGEMTNISGAVTDENGKVALTFDKAGTYVITAYVTTEDIEENYCTPAFMSLATITVTESATISGDANGDGIVDSNDAVLILRYFADSSVAIDEVAADITGDEIIDSSDAVAVMVMFAEG